MNEVEKLRDEQNAKEHKAIMDAVNDLKNHVVHKAEFKPVRNVVYGMVGIIMIFVLQSFLGTLVEAMAAVPDLYR